MDREIFRYYRSLANRFLKERLKGHMFHTSVDYEEVQVEGSKEPLFKRVTSTYVKPKEDAKV